MKPEDIKELRKAARLTRAEMATVLGGAISTVWSWEQDRTTPKGIYLRTLLNFKARVQQGEDIKATLQASIH
jgi:DNA-binding transcriptional regulator YiaG